MGKHSIDSDDDRHKKRKHHKRSHHHDDKEDRRREKERAKQMETPEEKRARRLRKKEEKERRRKEKLGLSDEYMGYTNADNPFGDVNLLETFTWHKKIEAAESKGITREELERREKRKKRENELEIEKVKKRREEREREREEQEEEKTMMQREKENERMGDWLAQEDSFQLEQAKRRSEIRIREGRAKPIDLLAVYLRKADDDSVLDVELSEPYSVVADLSFIDIEDLYEDIKVYQILENNIHEAFWEDMKTICDYELTQQRKQAVIHNPNAPVAERRALESGINPAVKDDIQRILKGKTSTQLVAMREQIESRIRNGGAGDVGYWETLLSELHAQLAKARIRESHQKVLERKLSLLRCKPIEEGDTDAADNASAEPSGDAEEPIFTEQDLLEAQEIQHEDIGDRSPKLIYNGDPDDEEGMEEEFVDEDADNAMLQEEREAVLAATRDQREEDQRNRRDDMLYRAEADRHMTEDEDSFNVDLTVSETYQWQDKYRPRKPRFFNRVHTGYEWNKYNQTHYDSDNPPPKVVQGYKFNVFYPDLIDPSVAPTYTLTPIESEPGFCVLKISAGPPYEDIAFKIVSRQWEYAHRKGFRCQFNNGIFQLWFQFRRDRYRR